MYLLDINACSRVIQGDLTVINRIVEVGEAQVETCVIVQADRSYRGHRKTCNSNAP